MPSATPTYLPQRRIRARCRTGSAHRERSPHERATVDRHCRRQHAGSGAGPRVVLRVNRSVKLGRIRPAGKAGQRVELSKQLAHQLVRVIFGAKLLEMSKHECERAIGISDRSLGKILALFVETFAMSNELFPIEL